ncbi:MAG: Tetratricopeptide repeat-containing protein [Myxococcales bacterium]|nr:Tetratricopeptide repeat-containing protein [Myxococcales bacterium]
MSLLLLDSGRVAEALVEARTAVELGKGLVALDGTNIDWQMLLEGCYAALGATLAILGNRDEALAAQRAGLAIAQTLVAADPSQVAMQTELAERHEEIGKLLWSTDRAAAVTAYRAAIAVYQQLVIAQPTNPEWPPIVEELTHTIARK